MNEPTANLAQLQNLTLEEVIEVTSVLLQDALDVASISRTLTPRILDGLYNGPLVRDLLLSWVSRAMEVRVRLQFWMETNAYASGLAVKTIGASFTHGSSLLMDLIEHMPTILAYTNLLIEVYEIPVVDVPPSTRNGR